MVLARTVRMRETCCDRGKKDYALLNAEGIVYISLVIITFNFFYFLNFFSGVSVLFMMIIYVYLECVASSEVPCDGDLL